MRTSFAAGEGIARSVGERLSMPKDERAKARMVLLLSYDDIDFVRWRKAA
jgi:hypothetical protein